MSRIQEVIGRLSLNDKIEMLLSFIEQWPEKDIDELLGEEIYLEQNPNVKEKRKQIIIGSSSAVAALEDSSIPEED
jgi:hypothetical protein